MAFNKRNDKGFNSIQKNNLSRPNNNNNNGNGVPIGNRYDGSSWSLSVDEDYIVLCFGEDGALDVVKVEKGVEDAEQVRDLNIHEKSPNADNQHDSTDQQDQDCINITPSKEVHYHHHHPDLFFSCLGVGVLQQSYQTMFLVNVHVQFPCRSRKRRLYTRVDSNIEKATEG